jgi:PIN domain nuclease of toxin-antitoxin system
VRLLLDTQVLLWAAIQPKKLSASARRLIADEKHEVLFSAASLWEVVIKRSLGRSDFTVDGSVLRRALLESGYAEIAVTGDHVLRVAGLPTLHKDPFDRLLLAQSYAEGATLLTADRVLERYKGPVRVI